jgi:hypothetical protein
VALSWALANQAGPYRIFSDMGTGYGVFVYKGETDQPAFVDKLLRAGLSYRYQITGQPASQTVVLAQLQADTFADSLREPFAGQPAALAISTPVPTALPPDAVLLGLLSDNRFTDDFNTLTIVGEVRNDSNVEVGHTDITVTFYDSGGNIIGTTQGETMLETIPPGDSSPFLITLTRPPGLASHSLRAVARPVAAASSAQLAVVELRRFEDEAGIFHIKGKIENVGSSVARRAKVAAVIYGRDGRVINVGFTYVNPPILAPGAQADYDVIFAYYPKYVTQTVIPFEE